MVSYDVSDQPEATTLVLLFKGQLSVSSLLYATEHRIRYLHHQLLSPRPFTPKHYLYMLTGDALALQERFLRAHSVTVLLLGLRSSKILLFPPQKCSVRFRGVLTTLTYSLYE